MSETTKLLDLVIIGGGPAGLTAGIYASRARLDVIMLEKMMPGGQVSITDDLENYPGYSSISGIDLAMKMEEQARNFGLEIKSEEVFEIIPQAQNKGHIIKTDVNTYHTKAILITSGAAPRRIGCEGEDSHIGKGVSYCATCDGAFFRNKEVVVVGGGDTAVEEGIFLTKFASKVTIIHRRDKFRAAQIIKERAFENEKVEIIWDSVVEKINGDPLVSSIDLLNVKTKERTNFKTDGVFVFVGYVPNNQFIPGIIKRDSSGFIIGNENMETNVPGIFVAGDIRSKLLRQVITACGDAATAVAAAEKYIDWNYKEEQYL